jgi:hypothetical protein
MRLLGAGALLATKTRGTNRGGTMGTAILIAMVAGVTYFLFLKWQYKHKHELLYAGKTEDDILQSQARQRRRLKLRLGGAAAGALAGMFFGIAGFGGAIAGTIPGAILGWYIAGRNASPADSNGTVQRPAASPPPPPTVPTVTKKADPFGVAAGVILGVSFGVFVMWPPSPLRNAVASQNPPPATSAPTSASVPTHAATPDKRECLRLRTNEEVARCSSR